MEKPLYPPDDPSRHTEGIRWPTIVYWFGLVPFMVTMLIIIGIYCVNW